MTLPSSPPTQPRDPKEVDLLLQFIHERDHSCPRCGYNLRNLTQPVCPECHEALALKVGITSLRVWWLLLAITPGAFCFVVCGIVSVASLRFGLPPFRGADWLLVWFFVLSGMAAVGLAVMHHRFLRASSGAQMAWALCAWLAHALVLLYCLFR